MISQQVWEGETLYHLQNDRLSVYLCPSLNNNVIRIYDHVLEREVLRVPDSKEVLLERPVHFGTPILLPPNRIKNGKFTFDGREYTFDLNRPLEGNHIHGVLRTQPWTVTSTKEEDGTISITSFIQTADFPEIQAQYPHALQLEMTYELKGTSLVQKLSILNQGELTAPIGYGLHTWFMIDGAPEKWNLRVPVSGIWELDEKNIPTERILELGTYAQLLDGMNLKGSKLDTVFQIGDNPCLAVLSGPGCEIRYSGGQEFKQWVLFTMGEADQYICLEPYTWVTNAPNIRLSPDITGIRSLPAGETLNLEVTLDIVHT